MSEKETEFMTPEQLGITPQEHKWLLKTALLLCEQGDNRVMPPLPGEKRKHYFYMPHWFMRLHTPHGGKLEGCGTMGCIKGTAWALAKGNGEKIPDGHSGALNKLFTRGYGRDLGTITPRQAAKATLGFLRTGKVEFPTT